MDLQMVGGWEGKIKIRCYCEWGRDNCICVCVSGVLSMLKTRSQWFTDKIMVWVHEYANKHTGNMFLVITSVGTEQQSGRKKMLMDLSDDIVNKFVNFSFNGKQPANQKDRVYKYAVQIISLGCFYLEYSDSIKEGDGRRIERCC